LGRGGSVRKTSANGCASSGLGIWLDGAGCIKAKRHEKGRLHQHGDVMSGYLRRLASRSLRSVPAFRSTLTLPFADLPVWQDIAEWPIASETNLSAVPTPEVHHTDRFLANQDFAPIKPDSINVEKTDAERLISRHSQSTSSQRQSTPIVTRLSLGAQKDNTSDPETGGSRQHDFITEPPSTSTYAVSENVTKGFETREEKFRPAQRSISGGTQPVSSSPMQAEAIRSEESASVTGGAFTLAEKRKPYPVKQSASEKRSLDSELSSINLPAPLVKKDVQTKPISKPRMDIAMPFLRETRNSSDSANKQNEPTEVHVTIGRIEVTAVHAPAAAPKRERTEKNKLMSLDEYLAKRQKGTP
jgi:hypothetical protein